MLLFVKMLPGNDLWFLMVLVLAEVSRVVEKEKRQRDERFDSAIIFSS